MFTKDAQDSFKFINFDNDINEDLFVDQNNEEFVVLPLYGTRKDTPRNIPEYEGLTPADYPGDNSEYTINGK